MSRYLLALIALFALVQPASGADKWTSVQSKNFYLVGNASEGAMKRVARNLEEFRAAFSSIFPGVADRSSVATTVIVFKDDASFGPFKPQYEGKPANVAGYFQSGPDMNFIALTGNAQTPHTIFHEYVHSLTKDGRALPAWVGEGIAEFYSTLESGDKDVLIGRPIDYHIITLNQLSMIPLDRFFAVEHTSEFYDERTKQGIFYAQSWAMIHYLMLGNSGRRRAQLSEYIAQMDSGKSGEESFAAAFDVDYATLQRELSLYVRGLSWPALRYRLTEKLDFEREMRATPISEGRAQFYLGDLLLHTNRLAEAETFLETAIRMEPAFAGNYASMGLLRMRQQKPDEALTFLTRAVDADSRNHITHYYYATLLQQQSQTQTGDERSQRLQRMRTHLKRSIELAPQFAEAYNMLGYVSLVLDDELSETETLLKKAIAFAPGRQQLVVTLAQVMLANKETAAARAVLSPLKNSSDVQIRNDVEVVLSRIERQLEYENDLREYERRRQALLDAASSAPDAGVDSTADDQPPTLDRNTRPLGGSALLDAPVARRPSGPQVEGLLTMIDCSRGVTLHVQIGNGKVELHTDNPDRLEFNSNNPTVKDSIACGPVNPAVPVTVSYRRTTDPRYLGEPISVIFETQ